MSAESASMAEQAMPPSIPGVGGAGSGSGAAAGAVEAALPRRVLPSLKIRALRGSAWTTFDYIAARMLSLISSMILTRLLVPHEKGLMDICNIVITGLHMFSDIGIGPNIIFSKRGDQPAFLNTAWTIQVLRGGALFLFTCAAAWPTAWLYGEPRLVHLMPICGFTSLILGFTSTSLVMLNRQMRLAMITLLDLASQVLAIVTMVIWAWYSPTVWSLVAGTYVMAIFRVVYSHRLTREHKMRFMWNSEDARSMFHFGRWIFLSTVLTFFAIHLDRLLFAKLLSVGANAIYSNAVMIAILPQQFIKKIGAQVAFPVLAEVARERPEELPQQFRRVRYPQVLLSMCAVIGLMVLAKPIIRIIYEGEWEDAAPMLQILAVGALGGVFNSTYGSALMAMKKTFHIMALLALQIALLVAATTVGYHHSGDTGFIWGVALVEWLNYPFTAAVMARFGLFQPRIDIPAILLSALAVVLAFWLLP